MFSRIPPVVTDDPRFAHGIYRAVRLPAVFWEASENEKPNQSHPTQAQIEEAVSKRIAELLGAKSVGDDPMKALMVAVKQNHALEERAKKAEDAAAALKAQLPDEAAVKKAAETLAAYEALGKPDELKTRLESGDTATQEAAALKRQQAQVAAAALLKLKPSALSEKWLGEGVPVIEGEGEAQKVVIVNGDKRTAWDDFVKANADLAEVLPALKLEPGANGASGQAWGGAAAHGKQAALGFDEDKARASQAGLYRDF